MIMINELKIINNWEKLQEKGIINKKDLMEFSRNNNNFYYEDLYKDLNDYYDLLDSRITELVYKSYFEKEGNRND